MGNKYNENRYVKRWALVKRAIDLLGGKCEKCDETHVAALSFHHTDPSKKEHLVSRMFQSTVDWKEIEKEVVKCKLLCENCHRKLHFNEKRFKDNYDKICNKVKGIKTSKEITIKKWEELEDVVLKRLHRSGKSIADIAVEMGREQSTIRRKIKLLSLPAVKRKRKEPIKITDEMKNLVWKLNSEFESAASISKKTNISLRVVYKLIKEQRNGK